MIKLAGYQVLHPIHDGVRSRLFRAEREADGRRVIIKVPKSEYPTVLELVQLQNQYNIAKDLDIDGIVRPLALQAFGNGLALVMEDKGGVSLQDFVKRGRPSLGMLLEIAVQIVHVLGELHAHRIIHKDIKPANILVCQEPLATKIIDFSIASLLPRESQEVKSVGVMEGTLSYMSPEQTGRMNRCIDYRSDFYSLGVTLYDIFTGHLPFPTSDPVELIHCHIARRPLPPREISDAIPSMLSDIVMKLLEKAAELRYQSASGIEADLSTCLARLRDNDLSSAFSLAARDSSDSFTIPEKLYGREPEIATLLAAFERVSQGTAEMMLVAGFSGIGKTALVNEVHRPILRRRGYFVAGKFDQFTRNVPFSSLVQAFRDLIRQLLTETGEQITAWKAQLLSALGEEGQVIIDVIPEVELLIGAQPKVADLLPADAQDRFYRLFQGFIQVFTSRAHPLVIFLDDLQWADPASLKLIQALISERGAHHLLLLCAYRDNEIVPAHPWTLTLDAIRKAGAVVNQIILSPLDLPNLCLLVADALDASPEDALGLSELVYQKTQGNPFFSNQFLKSLSQEGLITKAPGAKGFRYDLPTVRALAVSSDVVEFMVDQIKKLPPRTQAALKLGACMGSRFDLSTLAIVSERSRAETAADLWSALGEGLVLPVGEAYKLFQQRGAAPSEVKRIADLYIPYRFLHDRVQQAAYVMIPEEEKRSMHLRIGRLLLKSTPPEQLEERLFDITKQLNIGALLIEDPLERIHLAELNLRAGRRAKASTAYAAAARYLKTGKELLGADPWEEHYDLAMALYRESAEVEYLEGNFDEAGALIYRAIERAQTPLEKAGLYQVLIAQHTLRANYAEAIALGRTALALINIDLPEHDLAAARDREMAEVERQLAGREIAALFDLPDMIDPEKKVAMRILAAMGPPTYRSHQALWSVIVAKEVNLCLRYGNTPEVSYTYPAYGGLLGYVKQDYRTGDAFGDLTLRLSEKFNNPSEQSVTYLMVGSSIRHWSKHLKAATADYLTAYNVGLSSGNLQYAAYAFGHNMYCRFFQGTAQDELLAEITDYLSFSRRRKNQWAIALLEGGRLLASHLSEGDAQSHDLSSDELDEGTFIARCRANKNEQPLCIYHIIKAEILYVYERFEEALGCSLLAEDRLIHVATQGLLPSAEHVFIQALILTALYPKASPEDQPQYAARLRQHQDRLRIWAEACPENFLHKHLLVSAEVARISGDDLEAIDLYDRAIESALANDFAQNAAIASEAAARFWRLRGKEKIASAYLVDAYYGYVRWGANAKRRALELRYPTLLAPILERDPVYLHAGGTISHGATSGFLDLATVTKASQAISSEIVLDRLLTRLLSIMMENAGAQRGCLLLAHEGRISLMAEGFSETGQFVTLPKVPIEAEDAAEKVSSAIVHYVARTGTSVVLDDATRGGPFTADPYVIRRRPLSVLCTPMLNHGSLAGLVYLENNATYGAFTPTRLSLLGMLSGQAAISLENAVLVNNLEQRVEERTHELREAQRQLIAAARKAGMAEVTANVLHNVGNVTNSIGVTLSLLHDRLNEGRLWSLPSVAEMLGEHRNDLGGFLTEDPKGKVLPAFIARLAEHQGTARADMLANVEALHRHLEHIQTIIRREQSHAWTAQILEDVDLERLVEEALRIAMDADGWDNTQITREYAKLPPIETDRHQVLSIMVNLLSNARHALTEGPPDDRRITLRLFPVDRARIAAQVIDNGMGISEENLCRIFRHGFTTRAGGHGFGLHSGVLSARGLGGDLRAESGGAGKGATFTLELPLYRSPAPSG